MLDEMTQPNASKFAIFYICKRKPKFAFSFLCYFIFSLINALVYIYFEVVHRVISSSINILFLKSETATLFFFESLSLIYDSNWPTLNNIRFFVPIWQDQKAMAVRVLPLLYTLTANNVLLSCGFVNVVVLKVIHFTKSLVL